MTEEAPHGIPYTIRSSNRVRLLTGQLEAIRQRKPAAAALLDQYGITECELTVGEKRTKLVFTFPDDVNPYECAEFDREIFGMQNKATIIIDGPLERLTLQLGRVPCTDFSVGKTFWLDPSQFADAGPHAKEREALVTITSRAGYVVDMTFADGWVVKCDIDELRTWQGAWVDQTPPVSQPPTEPIPTIPELAAKLDLQVHPSVPWLCDIAKCEAAGKEAGWVEMLFTARYVPDDAAAFTTEEHAKLISCIMQDLAHGITTYCERDPGKYKHVTNITIVCESSSSGAWGFVHLK